LQARLRLLTLLDVHLQRTNLDIRDCITRRGVLVLVAER
jgi:hypothetical protein